VERILAFPERGLPRASDRWLQASLEQRRQQLLFPNGIAFDGNGSVRTAITAPAFSYLRPIESGNEGLVGHRSTEGALGEAAARSAKTAALSSKPQHRQ
jgi:hypothetical protein